MGLIKPTTNWTQIPNSWLRDKRLGYKELGLLCKLQSLPNGWEFSIKGMASIMNDGVDSVRSGVHRLEELGYLTREERKRGENGQLAGGDWVLHEFPFDEKKPISENTIQDKSTQIKKERKEERKNTPMRGRNQPQENSPHSPTESVSVESSPESLSIPTPVVRVEKWDFDSKGNWKRKRTVYTTIEEADKIEGADRDEWVAFSFWPSPPLVGQMDKAKTMNEKRTKLKTEYPDSPDSESQEVFHYEGI